MVARDEPCVRVGRDSGDCVYPDPEQAALAAETGKGWWTEGDARLRARPGGMPQNIVYRKATKAKSAEDAERWEEDEEAGTLSSHSPVDAHVVVDPQDAYRCTDYGKLRYEEADEAGPLTGNPDRTRTGAIVMATGQGNAEISEDAPTLNCNHEQPIVVNGLRATDGGADVDHAQAGHIIPGSVPRRLTPLECERLQGFPDGWTERGVDEAGEDVEMADSPRYRMCGNAVTVPVAHWLGWRILEVDKEIE